MAAVAPNGAEKVRVFSIDMNDCAGFRLNEDGSSEASRERYISGVCREIIKRGGKQSGFRPGGKTKKLRFTRSEPGGRKFVKLRMNKESLRFTASGGCR